MIWLRRPLGKTLGIAAAIAIVVAGLSPLGNMLLTPLEQRFPGMQFPEQRIDGIIVLGGSYDRIRGYLNTVILDDNTEPMVAVASLAPPLSGRKDHLLRRHGSFLTFPPKRPSRSSSSSRSELIPPASSSKTNRATPRKMRSFTARMIAPKPGTRWLLVTNAFHMPRAVGTFRNAGFDVSAFPVGWRTNGWRDFFWPAPSATEGLRRVDVAMREWFGLLAYRILGYSNALFPV